MPEAKAWLLRKKNKHIEDVDVSKNNGTQIRWFLMENPIKIIDDLGVFTPMFGSTPMWIFLWWSLMYWRLFDAVQLLEMQSGF